MANIIFEMRERDKMAQQSHLMKRPCFLALLRHAMVLVAPTLDLTNIKSVIEFQQTQNHFVVLCGGAISVSRR